MSKTFEPLEIVIQAPQEQIWKTLADIQNYHLWNNVVKKIDGSLKTGNNLKVTLETTQKGISASICKVVDVQPFSHFVLSRKLLFSRLLYLEHAFILRPEPFGNGKVRFIQTLKGSGWLMPFVTSSLLPVWNRFKEMNINLKYQTEKQFSGQASNKMRTH